MFHSAGSAIFGPLIAALNGPDQPDVRLSDFDVAQQDFPDSPPITTSSSRTGLSAGVAVKEGFPR